MTVAVSVITLPEATVVTALPAEVTVMVVVVAGLVCAETVTVPQTIAATAAHTAASLHNPARLR